MDIYVSNEPFWYPIDSKKHTMDFIQENLYKQEVLLITELDAKEFILEFYL